MGVLNTLKPEKVFEFFEEICAIPHGSGNTKLISDYVVSIAKKNNLKFIQDEFNNVIIFKDACPALTPVPLEDLTNFLCTGS